MYSVLFVCTGNTCRSPMAEHMFKKMLMEYRLAEEVSVRSAGLSSVTGQHISHNALKVLVRRGLQHVERHRARRVSHEQVSGANLVLAMTMDHKREIIRRFPEAVDKVYTLLEYATEDVLTKQLWDEWQKLTVETQLAHVGTSDGAGDEYVTSEARRLRLEFLEEQLPMLDIPDPFGQNEDAYELTAEELESACEQALFRLRRELAKGDGA